MDTQQMFQELDRLYAQGKLDEAEEKMMGWMKEGLDSGNKSLCLMMCNEMEGLYRNTGRVAQAVDMADMALSLIAGMGLDGSIHHGMTLLNAATARRMAGDVEKALSQYREAEAIFKNLGKTDGYEMASLYNNISQIYQEQEEHEKALESLDKALELIKKMENSEAEVATTHVNRALSLMALGRLDEADEELKESLTFYASPEGVQSGQYNYGRCMRRGDTVAAMLALDEFVRQAISMVYLLNRTYMPYYKWMFRGMENFQILPEVAEKIRELSVMGDTSEMWKPPFPPGWNPYVNQLDPRVGRIEEICQAVVGELRKQGLTDSRDAFLEAHTWEIMKRIQDPELKKCHVMEG